MAHVTFIHGIGNKPEQKDLLRIWRDRLADNMGVNLGTRGVTSSLVYWADVLYEKPDSELANYESFEEQAPAALEVATDPPLPPTNSPQETAFVAGLAAKVGGTLAAAQAIEAIEPDRTDATATGATYERVPLPWFVKKRFLDAFLRDVHHYLFNVTYSPRLNTSYEVQTEIRRRFIDDLKSHAGNRPHVVVSHSMGTVIAYDCLKRVADCPEVDGLMTIGSPLGLDEIQDKLQPGWSRDDGYPQVKVKGPWFNVFDRLDPVAGFDPFLANDYRLGGLAKIADIEEPNEGLWRHAIVKYLQGPKLRQSLRGMLGL